MLCARNGWLLWVRSLRAAVCGMSILGYISLFVSRPAKGQTDPSVDPDARGSGQQITDERDTPGDRVNPSAPRGPGGRVGFGSPGGPGGFGPGGPGGPERKLLAEFDANGDGWLNREERQQARTASPPPRRPRSGGPGNGPQPNTGPGEPGPGPRPGFGPGPGPGTGPDFIPGPGFERGPGGRGRIGRRPGGPSGPGGPGGPGPSEPPRPGKQIRPTDVAAVTGDLYDTSIVRTLFLDFQDSDWEEELEAFNNTDVDVPATLVVDGKTYSDVGVHFRGQSSFFSVPRGYKRSLNLSMDFIRDDQRLYGYKTLNLLNAHGDPSFLRTVLFSQMARQHIAAPKANWVRLVINGEDWGLYVNVQQFNKEFVQENFSSSQGARWKVPGSPNARGGLEYLGEEIEPYRQRYEIKSEDKETSWRKLIDLCRTLNETPAEELESALAPLLDLDSTLWFLALDAAAVNMDGYWVRSSDYSLYLSPEGKFTVVPHDMNESFSLGGGAPGMGGGPGMVRRPGMGPGPGFDGPFGPPAGPGRPPRSNGPPSPDGPPRPDGPPGFDGPRGPGRPDGPGGPGGPLAPSGNRHGPGGVHRSGPGGRGGVELDPLVGLDDPSKPLRSRLLSVPGLRASYLEKVRQIAEESFDWSRLEPLVLKSAGMVETMVAEDGKKLTSLAEFYRSTGLEPEEAQSDTQGSHRPAGLKEFFIKRREFLLNHPALADR